ncbi:unnamed protein product [Ilex paraguariensis]|uniref:Gnk2-homologous domain-containing protein n=1 Tax=Ilex paraguariensis TaxID=185542 RepID=A0ABC8U5P6_9AQUA
MLLLKDPKSYILFVMISINGFGQIFCVHAQALSYLCSDDIANSSYIDDRTSLLDSLSSRATSMDFYNETINDIHGLFLCRGDVNASTCQNCVTGTGEEIIRVCQPNRTTIIWYDFCMIHHCDINFFEELQSGQVVFFYNTQHFNSTEDPQNFAAVNFIQLLILDSLLMENLYTANSLPLPNGDQVTPPPPPSTPAPPTDQGNGGLKNITKIAVITVSTAAGVAV